MNVPVFDFHCDSAFKLLGEDLNQAGSLRKNACHIDLERAGKLPGYAQCFACFTTSDREVVGNLSPIVLFERELATIQREVDKNSDLISIAYTPAEIEENCKNGKMSAILTLEGTAGIDYNPELLEDLHTIGFRITSLGWNEKNPLTGSNVTGGGLTGPGLFNGTRTQGGNLFAQHTDYIFSSMGEELGFFGCLGVILLEFAIIARCIQVGSRCPDYMRRLICYGAASAMMFQVLINVGMCIGVMPVIGLTLPLISYGGSSVVTIYATMGLVSGSFARPQSLSHERYIQPYRGYNV